MTKSATTHKTRRGIWRSVGPAIIVASIVLGPGSIFTSSKVGVQFGYSMLWVLVGAGLLMMGLMALGARLGVTLDETPCGALARRWGRPIAVLIGITVFLIVALFQSGNNLAVLSALELLLPLERLGGGTAFTITMLVILNALIVATLYGFKRLYQPIEKLMMILVMIMLVAFAANLLAAWPSVVKVLEGFVPQLPADAKRQLIPVRGAGNTVVDPWFPIQGLFATTVSVAGAFYQAYLVREKGWGMQQVRQGTFDSVIGIAVLGGISMMIMITAGTVLHGQVNPDNVRNAGDVARQLEPAFGQWAKLLFSAGLFAAAFSSFMMNAAVGGTILSDSLNLGASIDGRYPKLLTTLALLVGMLAAIFAPFLKYGAVDTIILAQALTVLGLPLLAMVMLYLGLQSRRRQRGYVPIWMIGFAVIGVLVTIVLAIRVAWRLWLVVTG
jgi:manganese transport protein